MDVFVIIFSIIVFMFCIWCTIVVTSIQKDINNLYEYIRSTNAEESYDEHSATVFSKYTTFRVVPFVRTDGVTVYDVQYRNPSDTKWKTWRCEESYDEAYDAMNEFIERINKKKFEE